MRGAETKNGPTPRQIVTAALGQLADWKGAPGFSSGAADFILAALFNAGYVLPADEMPWWDPLARARKAERQRDALLDEWKYEMAHRHCPCARCEALRALIAGCESGDASIVPIIDPDVRQMVKAHGYPEATDDAEAAP